MNKDLSMQSLLKRLQEEELVSSQGGFLSKRYNFSQVSNNAVDDENLSIEAKGLYVIIQRWVTYYSSQRLDKEFLRKKCGVGIDKFNRIWSELKSNGYIKQYRVCSGKNKFIYVYDLLDIPDTKVEATTTISIKDYLAK